ncbi:MAG: DegV family protein [Anaerolineae bacterium]|nr:DegV family protein [Anaerolineae bacterium]
MSSIAVVTDSDASLPQHLAQAKNIRQVPINIHFGDVTFQTEVDITDVSLFERVDQEGALPTTSAPTPGQFSAAFQAALDEGYEQVFCLCVSSEVSGTYNSALTARDLFPEGRVTVMDTRSISMGQGYMALEAAAAAAEGADLDEIVRRVESVRARTTLFGALETLRYLAMSGRVGHLAAGMASLLNIKPLLTLRDGKLDMLEKVRTRHKVRARMMELVVEGLAGRPVERLAMIHVNALASAEAFAAQLCGVVDCPPETIFADFTAGLSVHTGPGMIGVVTVAADSAS